MEKEKVITKLVEADVDISVAEAVWLCIDEGFSKYRKEDFTQDNAELVIGDLLAIAHKAIVEAQRLRKKYVI